MDADTPKIILAALLMISEAMALVDRVKPNGILHAGAIMLRSLVAQDTSGLEARIAELEAQLAGKEDSHA